MKKMQVPLGVGLSILYLRCRHRTHPTTPRLHSPRPLSILYLRCLAAYVGGFGRRGAFNSLFEMHRKRAVEHKPLLSASFNSLFEMQGLGTVANWLRQGLESFNSLFEMPEIISCRTRGSTFSFNSLFEMRQEIQARHCRVGRAETSFNSLFEMPWRKTGAFWLAGSHLSILYLRCP